MAGSNDPFLSALDAVQGQTAQPDSFLAALDTVQSGSAPEKRSIGSRAYDAMFTPPEVVTRTANKVADVMDPALTLSDAEELERAPKVFGVPLSPRAVRSYYAGAVQGIGSLLTPGDVALTATGFGPLARAIRAVRGGARAVDAVQRGANIATAARGVERVADAESPSEALAGAAQVALGAAGARSRPAARTPAPVNRAALPPGARFVAAPDGRVAASGADIPMAQAPDGSFVRGVPAEYARHEVRGALPAGPAFVADASGNVAPVAAADTRGPAPRASGPDPSSVRSVPAAVIERDVDATVSGRLGVRPRQYSSDPNAVDVPLLSEDDAHLLRVAGDDISTFVPERGRLIWRGRKGGPEGQVYAHGGRGSYVAEDIRIISEQHVSNGAIDQARRDLLEGKPPTNRLHLAWLDWLRGVREGRPGYHRPQVPEEGLEAAYAARPDADAVDSALPAGEYADDVEDAFTAALNDVQGEDEFARFASSFDDIEPSPYREPGEEGFIRPMLAARLGGAVAGGATGAAAGETPEERVGFGFLGALTGAAAPSALRRSGWTRGSSAQRAIARKAAGRVGNRPQALVADYRARFGNVINSDLAKEIVSPEYGRSAADRRMYGQAVHVPSVRLFNLLVDDIVTRPATGSPVLVIAGAPGSGKSEVLKRLGTDAFDAVIETSLRNQGSSRALIDKLTKSGRRVHVVVVDRDVRASWADGVLSPQRVSEGRITPLEYHATTHAQVPRSVVQLASDLADDPRVSFRVMRNDDAGSQFVPLTALKERAYNVEDVRQALYDDTERLIAEGRIDAHVREAAYGDRSGSRRAAGASGARRGDSRSEAEGSVGRFFSDELGSLTPQVATHLAGGLGGAAYGYATGETPEEQMKRAALYGAAGAVAPALLRRPGARGVVPSGAPTGGRGVDTSVGGVRGVVSGPVRSGTPRQDPMDGMDVFIGKFHPAIQSGIRERIVANGGYDAQRRGVIDNKSLGRFANEVRINVEKTLPKGSALNAEALTAYARAIQQTQSKIGELARKVSAGTASDAEIVALKAAQADADVLSRSLAGARSEAGRSLAAFRFLGGVLESGNVNLIRGVADSLRDEAREIANGLAALPNDPLVRYRWLQKHGKPTLWDKARSVYYANILSGVKTHERNILGNVANIVSEIAVTPAAAAADAVRSVVTGQPRTVHLSEVQPGVVGAVAGMERGWSDMWFTLRHGVSPDSLRRAVTAAEAGKLDVPRVEFAGGVANPFNWPGRALDAADAFFRSAARNKELYQSAHAVATREGLRGEAFTRRVADLRAGLGPDAQMLHEQATDYARRAVFQEKPGRFASWVLQGHKVPVVGHVMPFVLPFIKTPANIFRQGLEFSPAGALMKAARQGGRAGAQAQGRAVVGSMAAGYLAWLAATGRLSGNGPSDPAERAALMESGWRPNSVRIGDAWVNYQLFQPVSVQAAIIGNAYEAWRQAGSQAGDAPDLVARTLARSANSFLDQSFFAGMFDFVEALREPEQSASRFVGRVSQGAIPFIGALRTAQLATDPVVRQPRGTAETFKAALPGLSKDVQPRIDRFGQVVVREGGPVRRAADPFNVSSVVSDPIADELNRLTPVAEGLGLTGWPLSLPSEQVAQREGRELTRAERTEVKRVRGQSVRQAIERVIQSPGYAQLSDEDRARELDAVIDRARREGTERFQEVRGRRSEQDFRAWYTQQAERLGLSTNPDDPQHFYDWRAAWRAGAEPDAQGHWPSQYKQLGHPNLIVDGRDTRNGQFASSDLQRASDVRRMRIERQVRSRRAAQ